MLARVGWWLTPPSLRKRPAFLLLRTVNWLIDTEPFPVDFIGQIRNTNFIFLFAFFPAPLPLVAIMWTLQKTRQTISQNSGLSSESEQPTCSQTGLGHGAELAPALLCRLEQELRELSFAVEAGGEVTAGWARHGSNRDQHVPVVIQADAWLQGGSKLELPNRWAEHCSEVQTSQGLDYQKGGIWKGLEHGLLVSFTHF